MLEALAEAADEDLAARVRVSIAHDEGLRQRRVAPQAVQHRPGRARAAAPAQPLPGLDRTISDAKQAQTTPGTTVRTEGQPPTGDPAVDEAYDGLGFTWNLYEQVYGRDSIDGKGMPLLGTVHYGQDYDNAFWDGTQMVFGDGDGVVFTRFTKSVDVIGHELTHGVTAHTAGLLYQGQSGALNESVSDVFGSLVKQHQLGQTATEADWLIGGELFEPGVQGRALRDMLHPGTAYDDPRLGGKDPQPADMAHYVTTTDDNGGVHLNSGIPNRAFALACVTLGGHAWETIGPIWYAVLTGDRIKADCDFATFAQLTVDAAATANGDGSAEHSAVRDAWVTVGVLTPDGGAAPDSAESGDPMRDVHGEVPSLDAEVLLRRTGGFAGLVRERPFSLGDLPERDTKNWQHLLAAPTLQQIALEDDGHPDRFCYSVTCQEAGVDVTVAEPHLPAAIHELFERTLEG
jgi:hypothetical protein